MVKTEKVYTVKITRSGSFSSRSSESKMSGTLSELIKSFSYTLEVGSSWSHEKGNKKINTNPRTIRSLITNLNNAKNNSASNGYSGWSYELV